MRLSHQFKDKKAERDVQEAVQLFISNKIGGMLLFDAQKDKTQYYANISGRTLKVIQDIKADGRPTAIQHRFYSLSIQRGGDQHDFLVPYFMNALLIKSATPIDLMMACEEIGKKGGRKHSISEKQGRVIVTTTMDDAVTYTVVHGENLTYDHDLKEGSKEFTLQLLSPKLAIAVSDNEEKALKEAEHLHANAARIEQIQESYISSADEFKDPEAALAYSCVMNVIESVLLSDNEAKPFYTDAGNLHLSIATNALLTGGEFKTLKKEMLKELDNQEDRLKSGKGTFEEAAWPLLLLGRMMNKLCSENKLFSYFTKEEIARAAMDVKKIAKTIKKKDQESSSLVTRSLMLSVFNLAYALTKDEEIRKNEVEFKESTKVLLEEMLSVMSREPSITPHTVASVFLVAYVYPLLVTNEEWKAWFDVILDKIHHNFNTLRRKIPKDDEYPIEMELFGLSSLAATVLNRLDAECYENTINKIIRTTIDESLYKGVIGRPSSAYDLDIDVEHTPLVQNTHLLNSALFLEMLRECA